ncbi:hypothetical protein [Oceanobacillus kapialis]|uniref:Helix-turn-helix domain-containing protein n=1 Tax=Oceanobacillus kapialis TaxID=481353 RepID=A0ABW5PXC8_9BACI
MNNRDIFLRRNGRLIAKLSKFNDKDAFNLHIRRVLYTFKEEMGGPLCEFVKYLSRYSMRYKGVSWQKVDTISKRFGKSEATVRRYLSKLTKLGIIGREKPEKGSHNITYFRTDLMLAELPSRSNDSRFKDKDFRVNNNSDEIGDDIPNMIDQKNSETTCDSKAEETKVMTETKTLKAKSKTKLKDIIRNKDNKGRLNDIASQKSNRKPLDPSFVPNWVPSKFVDAISPFFYNAETITKLWTKAAYAARKLGLCGNNEGPSCYVETIIEAFKVTIYNSKRRTIRGSFYGYFFGVVITMLRPFIYNTPRAIDNLELFKSYLHKVELE